MSRNMASEVNNDNLAIMHAQAGNSSIGLQRPAVPTPIHLRQLLATAQVRRQRPQLSDPVMPRTVTESVPHHVQASGRRLSTDSSGSAAPPPYLDAVLNLPAQNSFLVGQRSSTASYSGAPPSYMDAVINSQPNIPAGIHGRPTTMVPSTFARARAGPEHTNDSRIIDQRQPQPRSTVGSLSPDQVYPLWVIDIDNATPSDSWNNNPRYGADANTEKFSPISTRMLFTRKVFCILMTQFVVSSVIIGLIFLHLDLECSKIGMDSRRKWILIMILAILVAIHLTIVTYVSDWPRRESLLNIILLGLLTLSYSVSGGIFAALFGVDSLLYTTWMIVPISLAFVLFSLQSKWDLTNWSGFFIVSLVLTIIVAILMGIRIFYPTMLPSIKVLLLAFLGTIILSGIWIYNIKRIMDRKHMFAISPEEGVLGALAMYVDITVLSIVLCWFLACGNK